MQRFEGLLKESALFKEQQEQPLPSLHSCLAEDDDVRERMERPDGVGSYTLSSGLLTFVINETGFIARF